LPAFLRQALPSTMAAMNKSLAQINKSQDGGQSDQEAFGSMRCIRKAGLTHPMMADIEKELGVSP